jgi:hypothetical protein
MIPPPNNDSDFVFSFFSYLVAVIITSERAVNRLMLSTLIWLLVVKVPLRVTPDLDLYSLIPGTNPHIPQRGSNPFTADITVAPRGGRDSSKMETYKQESGYHSSQNEWGLPSPHE